MDTDKRTTAAALRRAWTQWKRFAAWIGKWNTRLLLTVTYFLAMGPISVMLRLLRKNPLEKRWRRGQSAWKKIDTGELTLEQSRYQS